MPGGLAALFSDPATSGDLPKITQELDAQLTWINRKLRSGMDRKIRNLSPRKRPLAASMSSVQEKIAELIPLLPAGHPLPSGAGMLQEGLQKLVNRISLSPQELARELLPERTTGHPLILRHAELHEETVGKLADLWRGLRFHFELVIDELEEAAKPKEKEEEAPPEPQPDAGTAPTAPTLQPELAAQILDALTAGHDLLARTLDPLLSFYQTFPAAMEEECRDWLQRYRTELARHASPRQIVHQLALRLSRPALAGDGTPSPRSWV